MVRIDISVLLVIQSFIIITEVGWCLGKHRVFCIQVGACINPVGVRIFMELVLPSSGF